MSFRYRHPGSGYSIAAVACPFCDVDAVAVGTHEGHVSWKWVTR